MTSINPQDLQSRIESWQRQADAGEITYEHLALSIWKEAEQLRLQFASLKLESDAYFAWRSHLVMRDAASQPWRFFVEEGVWKQRVEDGWQTGEPVWHKTALQAKEKTLSGNGASEPAAHPKPDPVEDNQAFRPLALLGAIMALLLVCSGLALVGRSTGPAAIVAATNTSTATSSPTRPATSTATTRPSPTNPPAAVINPTSTATPVPATPTPVPPTETATSLPELDPTGDTQAQTDPPTPEPATVTPSPTSTRIPTRQPSPTPAQPTGIIAYGAFDETIWTYNLYFRAWPDLNVVGVIARASQPAALPDGSRLIYRSWAGDRQGVFEQAWGSSESFRRSPILESMHPAWSPSGRLVYTANNSSNSKWHLYVNGDQLPIDGSLEGPTWLNENRLIFHGCILEGCGLMTAAADGSNLHRLTQYSRDRNPAPSPDGTQIAFMSDREKNWEIYRLAVDDQQADLIRLTNRPAIDILPVWSPDGKWIAFVSNQDDQWGVWLIPATGGTPELLFPMEGSPNGFVVEGPPGQAGWYQEQLSWFDP